MAETRKERLWRIRVNWALRLHRLAGGLPPSRMRILFPLNPDWIRAWTRKKAA